MVGFSTQILSVDTVFKQFIQSDGVSSFISFINELQQQGQKYEPIVIAIMDAFSSVSRVLEGNPL